MYIRLMTRSISVVSHAQVILVDHDRDPDLMRVDEQAAEAISSCCKDGPLACIQARHDFNASLGSDTQPGHRVYMPCRMCTQAAAMHFHSDALLVQCSCWSSAACCSASARGMPLCPQGQCIALPASRHAEGHAHASGSHQEHMPVQALARVVAEHMGGAAQHRQLSLRYFEAAGQLKGQAGSIVLPIGRLSVGLARHRALLFKTLADACELPCRMLRGPHIGRGPVTTPSCCYARFWMRPLGSRTGECQSGQLYHDTPRDGDIVVRTLFLPRSCGGQND